MVTSGSVLVVSSVVEAYTYPRGIAGLVRQAAQTYGADSARVVFKRLTAEEREHPERYFLNKASLLAVAEDLMNAGKKSEATTINAMAAAYYKKFP